jgi:hypothetical protein
MTRVAGLPSPTADGPPAPRSHAPPNPSFQSVHQLSAQAVRPVDRCAHVPSPNQCDRPTIRLTICASGGCTDVLCSHPQSKRGRSGRRGPQAPHQRPPSGQRKAGCQDETIDAQGMAGLEQPRANSAAILALDSANGLRRPASIWQTPPMLYASQLRASGRLTTSVRRESRDPFHDAGYLDPGSAAHHAASP